MGEMPQQVGQISPTGIRGDPGIFRRADSGRQIEIPLLSPTEQNLGVDPFKLKSMPVGKWLEAYSENTMRLCGVQEALRKALIEDIVVIRQGLDALAGDRHLGEVLVGGLKLRGHDPLVATHTGNTRT